MGASRCGDKLNLDICRIVNSHDSTEIPQLETSIRYVVGESNCLVQDEHDLLRKCSDEVFAHRSRHLTPIRGSVKYPVHQCTLRRTDQNGKVAATSERRISRVSGSMGEGSKPMWR